ncbi:HNH endonuclease signature motif containing protein [Methylobacterium sp. Leaf108]|uniref:HNH endonuclease n=1 Tax=Methylobacterium sp. Leaf108 TaxID=1736256 RepID=UPI0006F352A2|nr:HNH endonuclease signature motif containing protein [Methylobacterium sp. Leaf108]KQP61092.1 hypothetical protein ASF39_15585 [Methylobacterium sp. Leaf108]
MRKRRSDKVRLRILKAHNHTCHVCGGKIDPGEGWDLDHIIPLALFGEDEESNLAPAHRKGCHSAKTATQDAPAIARAVRRETRHFGAHAPKREIQSAGFAPRPPQNRATKPLTKIAVDNRRPTP